MCLQVLFVLPIPDLYGDTNVLYSSGMKPGAWIELQGIGVLASDEGQDISDTGIME
jgi:hypothetical protein